MERDAMARGVADHQLMVEALRIATSEGRATDLT